MARLVRSRLWLILLASLVCGYAVRFIDFSRFSNAISENQLLESLKRTTKTPKLLPSSQSSELSEAIFDIDFPADAESIEFLGLFNSAILDRQTLHIRLPMDRDVTSMRIRFSATPEESSKIFIKDNLGRMVFACYQENCKTSDFSLVPGTRLLRIQAIDFSDNFESDLLSLDILTASTNNKHARVPQLHFVLDKVQRLQFDTLTKKARKITSKGIWDIPGNRINVSMRCCNSNSDKQSYASIRLSGRNPGHFETFPPSMAVSITKGASILGAKSFKLYRPEQRQGILDHVLHSLLSDYDVIAPMQRIVEVYIDGRFAGYFLFEETYSTGFFENLELSEGAIYGYDLKRFFQDYPDKVRLIPDQLYGPYSPREGASELNYMFGQSFANRIDIEAFTRIIAFLGLFSATHGLGADDLRFYQDPLSNSFFPIARDLKVGAWPESLSGFDRSFNSHFSFLSQGRPVSMQPFAELWSNRSPTDNSYRGSSLGVWDVHPAIFGFLNSIENRLKVENIILELSKSSVLDVFNRRVTNAVHFVKFLYDTRPPADTISNTENFFYLTQSHLSKLSDHQHVFLGSSITELISKTPLVAKQIDQGRWRVFNRLPFHVLFSGEPNWCTTLSGQSIIGPLTNGYATSPTVDNLQTVVSLYRNPIISPFTPPPFCTVEAENLSGIRFTLANGQPIALTYLQLEPSDSRLYAQTWSENPEEAWLEKSTIKEPINDDPDLISTEECFSNYVEHFSDLRVAFQQSPGTLTASQWGKDHFIRHGQGEFRHKQLIDPCKTTIQDFTKDRTAVLVFIDQKISTTHAHLRYALHLGDDLHWNNESLRLLDHNNDPLGSPDSTRAFQLPIRSSTTLPDDRARLLTIALSDSIRLFTRNSIIFEISIPLTATPQYFHVNKNGLETLFDGQAEQLLVFDSTENIIPPKDSKFLPPEDTLTRINNWVGPGSMTIAKPLIVTEDESLVLSPGDHLLFGPSAYLLVKGRLQIQGTLDAPVVMTAIDDQWGGIVLSGTFKDNFIDHANISKIRSPSPYLGGISVLRSNLHISNSMIEDIYSEDGINVSHGRLVLHASTIQNAASDCIDSDFSFGIIERNHIRQCGGDAIDMNHSFFNINFNILNENNDKGLSCGEKSVCKAQSNLFNANATAIAAKDSAYLISTRNRYVDNEIGIASFVKKPWYTSPHIRDTNSVYRGNGVKRASLGFFQY